MIQLNIFFIVQNLKIDNFLINLILMDYQLITERKEKILSEIMNLIEENETGIYVRQRKRC